MDVRENEAGPVSLAIAPEDWREVVRILQARVPHCEVWAFGSRTTGKAKRFSDLDLGLSGSEPLPLATEAQLADEFENSNLPFRVDLVDLCTADPAFSARVKREGVRLPLGSPAT